MNTQEREDMARKHSKRMGGGMRVYTTVLAAVTDTCAKQNGRISRLEKELSELRDNHMPKVKAALGRANKMGAEADDIIMDMAEHLRLAIQAIEGGEHHGNGSYTQRFGQEFLERLKKSQERIRVVPPEHRTNP